MMELVRYEADSGKEVVITDDDIRFVLAGNQNVTNEEMKLFVELCAAHKLDPFIREAYIIKYGTQAATIVVGKDVWLKRAMRNPRYRGHQAGITIIGVDGRIRRREGSMLMEGEALIGGWAKVYISGFETAIYDEVSFDEYKGTKKDGSLTRQWAKMPGTMIRKVALVHVLREAFPDEFGGCYDAAEMGVELPPGSGSAGASLEIRDEVREGAAYQGDAQRIPMFEEDADAQGDYEVPYGPDGWGEMDDRQKVEFVEEVAARASDGMRPF